MANLLFATRESDSLRSENPGMSQPSRGLVLSFSVGGMNLGFQGVLTKRGGSTQRGYIIARAEAQQWFLAKSNNLAHVISPALERDLALRQILLAVVGASNAGLRAADVVQYGLNNVRRDSDVRHAA